MMGAEKVNSLPMLAWMFRRYALQHDNGGLGHTKKQVSSGNLFLQMNGLELGQRHIGDRAIVRTDGFLCEFIVVHKIRIIGIFRMLNRRI